jgi:small subunit ribosomal protein S14
MARKAKIEKWKRELVAFADPEFDQRSMRGRKLKFKVRHRNRCALCGRPRAYMRVFGMCRICFREHAVQGNVPGVTKSSW